MEPATPRKIPHKKPPLPLKRPKITFLEKKYRGENEEGIRMNMMQHLTSMDLNDKEAEKEILEVLKYYLIDYKEIPENHQDPEFKKNLEKDITIFQNYVNNQTGGRRRKRKTRKKRGGWRRRDIDLNKDDIGYYYDCWNRDGNYDDVKYREGMTITGKWDVLRPISEWDIIEMQDSHRYDPNLILYDESRPNFGRFRIPAQQLCSRGFKPLKRNDVKTGAGRKKKTRKKRGAVKFGKNKTTAEIVKEGRKILKTTPQKKKRQIREQQIKLTGEQEFALFKKQSLIEMSIAFQTTFGIAPSNRDRKILSLVYKNLKEPLSEAEEDDIKKYRAEEEENKRKFVWMNNYLRQLKKKSQKKKFEIYNHGDNPKALLKYKTGKKKVKKGPATGLVINTDNKYMSPVKGPDTRYSDTNFAVEERAKNVRKSHKNLIDYFGGGRKKKTRKKKGSHHEPLLLAAVAVSKLISKKNKKKYKKRRTKKKSRR